MDGLAGLLDGPRARQAFLLRTVMSPPWCVRVQDEAPLSLTAVVSGGVWVLPDVGEPVRLAPGEVAVSRGPDPFTFADDPASPPQFVSTMFRDEGWTVDALDALAPAMTGGLVDHFRVANPFDNDD